VRLPARSVLALNTGAFQRLIGRQHFAEHAKRAPGEKDPQFLARLRHEDMAACYPAVEVRYEERYPKVTLLQWLMDETGAPGSFVAACSSACSAPPANCSP
jgi:hypothetical protein